MYFITVDFIYLENCCWVWDQRRDMTCPSNRLQLHSGLAFRIKPQRILTSTQHSLKIQKPRCENSVRIYLEPSIAQLFVDYLDMSCILLSLLYIIIILWTTILLPMIVFLLSQLCPALSWQHSTCSQGTSSVPHLTKNISRIAHIRLELHPSCQTIIWQLRHTKWHTLQYL